MIPPPSEQSTGTPFPIQSLVHPENFSIYTEHLDALDLLRLPVTTDSIVGDPPLRLEYGGHVISITRLGKRFVEACIPAGFDLAKSKKSDARRGPDGHSPRPGRQSTIH